MKARRAGEDAEGLREAIWVSLTGGPEGKPRARWQRPAYAFELWIAHLTLLEQVLQLAPLSWHELRAAELDGLLMLRAARERFQREYRACGVCGAPVKGKICPRCGDVKQ
jgi:hypothetical protein